MKKANDIRLGLMYGSIAAVLIAVILTILLVSDANTIIAHTITKVLAFTIFTGICFAHFNRLTHEVAVGNALRLGTGMGLSSAIILLIAEALVSLISNQALAPVSMVEYDVPMVVWYAGLFFEVFTYSMVGSFIWFQYYKRPIEKMDKKVEESDSYNMKEQQS